MNRALVPILTLAIVLCGGATVASAGDPPAKTIQERVPGLKAEVEEMIAHSWNKYINHAFPLDELNPALCSGSDTQGGYSLTVIDSLDTLALIGHHTQFRKYATWVVENVVARRDVNVSLFETNIRVVGGLLSAHFMLSEGVVTPREPGDARLQDELLLLAVRFADRLLPAFTESPTGIPFGNLNLHHGVWSDEVQETATASATTYSLEFTILSALTGNPKYERASRKALRAIFESRTHLNLVGNHINLTTKEWTVRHYGPGTGIDSFLEYLIKTFLLTGGGDLEYWSMYEEMRYVTERFTKKGPWRMEVDIFSGTHVHPVHNSLASFYAGNLVLVGRLDEAKEAIDAVHTVFRRYGALPEGFNLHQNEPIHGQLGYPLRPEHIESIYMAYRATKDPSYLVRGEELLKALQQRTRTKCGFTSLGDVRPPNLQEREEWKDYYRSARISTTIDEAPEGIPPSVESSKKDQGKGGEKQPPRYMTEVKDPFALMGNPAKDEFSHKMDSFWISETLKYFYLLFADDASGSGGKKAASTNNGGGAHAFFDSNGGLPSRWVFNTEGHPFPIKYQWASWNDAHYDRRVHRQSAGFSVDRTDVDALFARGQSEAGEEFPSAVSNNEPNIFKKRAPKRKKKDPPTEDTEEVLPRAPPPPLPEDLYERLKCPRGRRSTLFASRREFKGRV